MKRVCKHTKFEEYRWEWDNGYGQQKWLIGHKCKSCGKKNSFPNSSTNWSDPKDLDN